MRRHVTTRLLLGSAATPLLALGLAVPAVADGPPAPAAPAVTLLPPLPLTLGDGAPCTAASERTASSGSWVRRTLGYSRAQELSRGAGVTVAVVDTGVGGAVPVLAGRVSALAGAGTDCVGHGSFLAGVIAAAPAEGSGVVGIAPAADVLAVSGTDDRGAWEAALVADGIRSAVDAGADVVCTGAALRSGRGVLTAAVRYATAHDVLVVAPAAPDLAADTRGDAPPPSGPYWPAAVPEVLAVVDFGPDGSRPAEAPDAYRPDLAAPGDQVVGVGPRGQGHWIGSGSSIAAATAAGAAALVRARHPTMPAAEVSRQLTEASYPADVPRLDPYAALATVLPEGRTAAAAPAAPVRMPAAADPQPGRRALVVAGAGLAVVLLVAGALAVVPLGRARKWVPQGRRLPGGR
ncbi:S8 family serine peptidase [Streptomyces sp. AM 2-1-1]|uniref:S8 family serine peptidase n=1 Tax=Streptomyces sp. AM 2-1-1 TaxID=3028709 RepID=UPI0023B9918C|nr:S8 family serine peptidase [Streptomyces sp. AM 2-1-1]WEH43409.1 S8 family serine peptidase [Streptomyces sp. AM 2-1-1]